MQTIEGVATPASQENPGRPDDDLRALLRAHQALAAAETPAQVRECAAAGAEGLFPGAHCLFGSAPTTGGNRLEGTETRWVFARLPVVSDQETWGALEIRRRADEPGDRRDLAFLELYAGAVAEACRRAAEGDRARSGALQGLQADGGGRIPPEILQSDKLIALGQMAAGIAHQINNPLTAVSSHAQLLSLQARDPRAAESAARITEGVERIDRLVRNLMSFVRSDEDGFYPIDLNQVVHDTLSFSRYDLTRGDTKLVEDLATPLPRVLAAKDQLEHVLLNLLTNARDAVSGRGTIRISTRAGDEKVFLEVADDGIGIGPEQLEHIFEPFYTTKPAGKGSGLGLFVAAGIARRHGAELRVSSEAGRGTLSTLALPVFSA